MLELIELINLLSLLELLEWLELLAARKLLETDRAICPSVVCCVLYPKVFFRRPVSLGMVALAPPPTLFSLFWILNLKGHQNCMLG